MIDSGLQKKKEALSSSFNEIDKLQGLKNKDLRDLESSTTIHIGTLRQFTDYRAGRYAMSGLKKMTGTESFMGLSDGVKSCQTQPMEECVTQRYIDVVLKECGCIPWYLSNIVKQVDIIRAIFLVIRVTTAVLS